MILCAGLSIVFTSCASLGGAKTFSAGTSVATQYLFRGVPQTDALVSQSNLDASIDLGNGDTFNLGFWANMDLSNDAGGGVFPDGNGGKITEFDIVPTYSTSFYGMAVDLGITNYNFPNGVGASTNELFVTVGREFGGLDGSLTINYDFDEVEDYYLALALERAFQVDNQTTATAAVGLGVAGEDQGLAYFGARESGLSDANVSLSLNYQSSEAVVLTAGVMVSSIINSDYQDALDATGIDTDNVTFWIGMSF